MSEHLLHHPQIDDPGGQREGSGTVPQVVQADRRQSGISGELPEDAGEPVRGHRITIEIGKQVTTAVVLLPERGPLGFLPDPMRAQRGDRRPLQRDHPGAVRGLRRANHQVPVVLLELPADHRDTGVEVDVTPPQPGCLTAPQTTQRDQVVGRVQAMVVDGCRNWAVWAAVQTAIAGRSPVR